MSVSPEILASQQEYASRPFAARVETSHFSGTFRFHNLADAVAYIFDQFKRVKGIVQTRAYGNDWVNFDCRRSYVDGPGFEWSARDILLIRECSTSGGIY